jgi:hypothetical protein
MNALNKAGKSRQAQALGNDINVAQIALGLSPDRSEGMSAADMESQALKLIKKIPAPPFEFECRFLTRYVGSFMGVQKYVEAFKVLFPVRPYEADPQVYLYKDVAKVIHDAASVEQEVLVARIVTDGSQLQHPQSLTSCRESRYHILLLERVLLAAAPLSQACEALVEGPLHGRSLCFVACSCWRISKRKLSPNRRACLLHV